ncbi:MAG TPA: DUF4833 domain-containing protein, partial [Polyangiales bacterium]
MNARRLSAVSTLFVASLLLLFSLARPHVSSADAVSFGPHDVRSIFYVAKSENQNQVHYAMRVDANCKPSAKAPVFAYWRRLRKGVRYDEPLLPPGTRLYGASDEQDVVANKTGSVVRMYVKALKRLPIDIQVEKLNGTCKTTATVTLKGERARLSYAYLQLGRLGITVKYVDVVGYRVRDGVKVVQ